MSRLSVTQPRILDLFCGAGGAAMGYHRAGFEVVGVDIKPQPHYPFEFHQADALTFPLDGFDAIHASPPCQAYSVHLRHMAAEGYPQLIGDVRTRLQSAGVPWVVENVVGAPIPSSTTLFGEHGLLLCGSMFGLRVWRHRLFLLSAPATAPRGCDHRRSPLNPYNAVSRRRDGIQFGRRKAFASALGVEWMASESETTEAIPPAYTEWIGSQLVAALEAAA